MKKNIGKIDKAIRISAGIVIGGLGVFYQSWWGLIGIVPMLTGLLGWCPAYCPFKIKTNK
jgi:hypothetical protein